MKEVASSIGWDDNLVNKYPKYSEEYKELEYIHSYNTYCCDYRFYRKNIIGTSWGLDESFLKKDVFYDQSSDQQYVKNTKKVSTRDYTYSWYKNVEIDTTIGFNKRYFDLGYEMVRTGNLVEATLYYEPVSNTGYGYPHHGYAFYDEDGYFLGASTSDSLSQFANAVKSEEYDGWIYHPNSIRTQDYIYKWVEKVHVEDTHGYSPEMENNGYYYKTGNTKELGIPDYISDYQYTYFTKDIVVERFGFDRDYDWGADIISERIDGTDRNDIVSYKTTRWDYEYHYYDYIDGYDAEKVNKLFNRGDDNSTAIIKNINVVDDTFRGKSGLEVDLLKKSTSNVTTYRIMPTSDGYEAVAVGTIESNKSSIVLQPINR